MQRSEVRDIVNAAVPLLGDDWTAETTKSLWDIRLTRESDGLKFQMDVRGNAPQRVYAKPTWQMNGLGDPLSIKFSLDSDAQARAVVFVEALRQALPALEAEIERWKVRNALFAAQTQMAAAQRDLLLKALAMPGVPFRVSDSMSYGSGQPSASFQRPWDMANIVKLNAYVHAPGPDLDHTRLNVTLQIEEIPPDLAERICAAIGAWWSENAL